jgi:uncharacterized protein YecE (DUF72 family)
MDTQRTQYLIGVGGWEHEVLDRCLYPRAGMTSAEKLAYYAGFFNATEVRSTFWDDTLAPGDAREWVEAVRGARDFMFCVKLHRTFTHQRKISSAITRSVRGVLQELARHNRLGALLLQFPYTYTNTGAGRHHLVKLAEVFTGFPLHVEFRHESWQSPSLRSFLADNGLRPVSADLPRVRQLMPFLTGVVGETAYLRLHGRNEKGWLLNTMDTRYDYLYNARELMELRRRLDALSGRCRRVVVICNNTTGGKAVANALQLGCALHEGDRFPVPDAAFRTFPSVQELGAPMEQATLFDRPGLRTAI